MLLAMEARPMGDTGGDRTFLRYKDHVAIAALPV
jgi:hypothetical protein